MNARTVDDDDLGVTAGPAGAWGSCPNGCGWTTSSERGDARRGALSHAEARARTRTHLTTCPET